MAENLERAVAVHLPTPFGLSLLVTATAGALVGARFTPARGSAARVRHPILNAAASQVRAYFERRLRRFDLPLRFAGTPLQEEVWDTVRELEFGQIVSYGDIARAVGRPLAHRGVASALRKSPIDLFVAAHRAVGADGRARGCGPHSIRARLLAFERQPRR